MTAGDAQLEELSDDQRLTLETLLVKFDLSWDKGRLEAWVPRLPPRGDSLRHIALVEMVKIDLERRWLHGQRAKVEAYVKALPDLGTLDRVPADLLLAEYEARQHCGAQADLDEFARRFPRQADELRRLVVQWRDEDHVTAKPKCLEGRTMASDESDCRAKGPVALDVPTPFPAGTAFRAVSLPEKFGRYRIVRELGRGAMGAVYLAHDSQLDRMVALKVPQFSAADGPEIRQRFHSEARAAATIEHPGVCPVYDVGEISGTPYLTMAYLQGQPLSHILEGTKPLPERKAASLVRQLTAALQAAHERGVIHRDLKPSNVIINQRGEPVVLDFGLARRVHENGRLTQTGQPVGTPAYMSPEQVAGAVRLMGPGCDIYALGVILYQLLTGRLPFEGSMAEVLGQIVTQPPAPPSKLRPGLDPRLEAVCLKALSKQVVDRYASMRDLGAALSDCSRGDSALTAIRTPQAVGPTPSPHRGVGPRRTWFGRRSWWLVLAGGGLACVAGVVLLVSVALWFTNSRGTIRIDLDGPRDGIEVQVDGEQIESAAVNEPMRLRPGNHHLLITGKQIQTVSTSFTVTRGDNLDLHVQIEARADGAGDPRPAGQHRRHDDDDDDPDDD
jgi:hypothetical protein